MMIKTSNLSGPALSWAVAIAEGKAGDCEVHAGNVMYGSVTSGFVVYRPDENWSQGGPIIDNEDIALGHGNSKEHPDNKFSATKIGLHPWAVQASGPTKLIAAMRCYVASKLGDEIDIPRPAARLGQCPPDTAQRS